MLRPSIRASILAPFLLALASGCGGGDDESSGALPFVLQSTSQGVAGTTPVRISGRFVAYLADEATTSPGQNFNTDADTIDSVAFVVDLLNLSQRNSQVAAEDMYWLGSNLYMRVSEALDTVDWNGDMDMTDQVLVHWVPGGVASFVATLAPGTGTVLKSGGRLFVALEDLGAPGMGMTNLGRIESSRPMTVEIVPTTDMNMGGLRPAFVGEDEDLVFVTMDETLDGDLNGDADGTDAFVLGLIDATITTPTLQNVALGVADGNVPHRALATGNSDWLVGFLVNEAAEAETSVTGLNDRALFSGTWEPPHCVGMNDTDTADNVLFYLNFADFIDAMTPIPPENTGLVGVDRVIAVDGFVATISLEADDGGCDLNNDGDSTDRVFRWVEAVTPILPPTSPVNHLHALADGGLGTADETFGVAELDGRFVILVSEANDDRDHNGDMRPPLMGTRFDLLGWFNPSSSASFTFDHGVGGPFYAGATWMAEHRTRALLYVGRPENVDDTNENTVFGADMDTLDSMPSFLDFVGSRMSFPSAPLATETNNSGLLAGAGFGFYRISEAEETLDFNGDGDMLDFGLARSSFTTGFTAFVGISSSLPRPAAELDLSGGSILGGAIIADEAAAGVDFNGDGDTLDLVLRHFRL